MAHSRKTDPATSHAAASEAESSGRASAQRNACLDEVLKNSGQTAAEIASATGMERHAPSRRLPELRSTGQVKNGEARICKITGRLSLSWLPAQEGQE